MTHGRVPRIVPLLRERAQDVPFLIVEVGREGGRLRLSHGRPEAVDDTTAVEGRTDFLSKVQAGGWSHARYQRATEEVWRANAEEVGNTVDRMVREHEPALVIVSGDVRARELLLEDLAPESLDRVVEVPTHTRAAGASSEALDAEIDIRLEEELERDRQDVLARSATGGGRRGERGLGPVVHALQQAQVETLLLDPRRDERSLLAPDGPPWIATEPAAIVLWNTVYLDRAITTLNGTDTPPSPELLRYLSPLSWEHINLTGNYTWSRATHKPGTYRPLRRSPRR